MVDKGLLPYTVLSKVEQEVKLEQVATNRSVNQLDSEIATPTRIMTASQSKMPQLPALDGFRALAIGIVILSHVGFSHVIPGGFGVTIFFFLSGFLITSLLRFEGARNKRISLRSFYIKRVFRIFPPLYISLLFVTVLGYYGLINSVPSVSGLITDAVFLTNYSHQFGSNAGTIMPLWSLDVEEHFYIIFPLIFSFIFLRITSKSAALICLALSAAFLLIRCAIAISNDDLYNVYFWSHTRVDSILWGSILAMWNNPIADKSPWLPSRWHLLGAFSILIICLIIRSQIFRETIRYTLQGASLFVIFSYTLQTKGLINKLLSLKMLKPLALLSYTLYLAHLPALRLAEHMALPVPALTGLVIACAYAAVMYWVVEKPLTRLRRKSYIQS